MGQFRQFEAVEHMQNSISYIKVAQQLCSSIVKSFI